MKKKILFFVVGFSFLASANTSFVVVMDKNSNYEIWNEEIVRYTEWENISTPYDCSEWLPTMSSQEMDYQQTETCNQRQERTKTVVRVESKTGNEKVISSVVEDQIVSLENKRNIVVTSNSETNKGGLHSCTTWLPLASDYYYGEDVNQSRTCSQDKEQNFIHSLSGSSLYVYTKERTEMKDYNQTVNGSTQHTITMRSCSYDNTVAGKCPSSRMITSYEDIGLSRGWSVMVLDPNTFKRKSFAHYDNHGYPTKIDDMEVFLRNIKDGDLVLIGTYDQPAYITDSFISTMGELFGADTAFLSSIKTVHPNSNTTGYRSSYNLVAYKNGEKKAEDKGFRYEDSHITINLPN